MNIDTQELYNTIIKQLSSFWNVDDIDGAIFMADIESAAKMTVNSYDESAKSYYKALGFSVMNSAVYAVFLYYLSNLIGKRGGGYRTCR